MPLDFGEDELLLELRVKDIGIIEDINWSLSGGLNVITGEMGAGKSLGERVYRVIQWTPKTGMPKRELVSVSGRC